MLTGSVLVTEMLLAILATCSPEELEGEEEEEDEDLPVDLALPPTELSARRQQIKNKILAVGKMQRVFQLLRCVLKLRVWLSVGGSQILRVVSAIDAVPTLTLPCFSPLTDR